MLAEGNAEWRDLALRDAQQNTAVLQPPFTKDQLRRSGILQPRT